MFREKQKMAVPAFGAVKYHQYKPSAQNPDVCVESDVDAVNDDLPPCVNFKLSTLLKAGVPLEKVNSRCIAGNLADEVAAAAAAAVEKSEPTPEN